MLSLVQKLKDGKVQVCEVPAPLCSDGAIVIRNHFSLVSAGTEGSTVSAARKSLIGKAKERPQQVKQVLDVLRTQGVTQTFRAVNKKLDSLSPLGYSCAGEVVEVGSQVQGFRVGDHVAAGGSTANHAELVAVPEKLCVKLKLDDRLDLAEQLQAAAYNTLGAIALQGVRQADLRLGETCAVIGLGLIGQLTCQLLRASGVKVIGLDIDSRAVEIAEKHSADLAMQMGGDDCGARVNDFSDGLGVDAVIITAASTSAGPINFAGEISRKKGRVVIVGDVATCFDRNPHYYRKELEVRMSCSYGPGRYDPTYEEHGIDYPPAYVRWTEQRNMAAFQEIVRTGGVQTRALTSHLVKLESAPNVYDMIVNKSEPYLGVLVQYDTRKKPVHKRIEIRPAKSAAKVNLAFIGAGSYAQGFLLPNLPKNDPNVARKVVMTNSGTSSRGVAERFGFESCTSDEGDIFDNPDINTVLVSTRHDTHAKYVLKALRADKHVFVDKPLCITPEDLTEIESVYKSLAEKPVLMVGYNRRYAPLARKLKEFIGDGSMTMLYRVNAGALPGGHWIEDPLIGGGRILGEVCHFVDFMSYVCGAVPADVKVFAQSNKAGSLEGTTIIIKFDNDSIGTILYTAIGSSRLEKECFEVHKDGNSAVISDFRKLATYTKRGGRVKKSVQDKGQKAMLKSFLASIESPMKSVSQFGSDIALSRAIFDINALI
jgi:predicted dehydrogenase